MLFSHRSSSSTAPKGNTKGQHKALMGLYLVLSLLALWVLHDFLPSMLWASVLAITLWPAFQKLQTLPLLQGKPRLTALVLVVLIAVLSIVPLVIGVARISGEMHALFALSRAVQTTGIPQPDWLANFPVGSTQAIAWWQDNLVGGASGGNDLLAKLPHGSLAAYGGVVGKQVVHVLVVYGFMLLVLFFIFAGGTRLQAQLLQGMARAFGQDGANLASHMAISVRGTVSGLVLVGLGEGVLLGLAFLLAGAPHPVLLGSIAAVAAMLPFCAYLMGTAVALWLLVAHGAAGTAVVVWLASLAIVFVSEHFVRPLLIQGTSQLPFALVFFGILGGAETLGVLGLFIGPALMTVLVVIWRHFTDPNDPLPHVKVEAPPSP